MLACNAPLWKSPKHAWRDAGKRARACGQSSCCYEVPTGCVAAIGFVVSCGYPSELFDLCEVILHQMPPLVDLRVIIALDFTIGFGRDHSGCTALVEVLQQPVRIERLVREQCVKRNAFDQRCDTFHVMRLPRQ